MLLVVDDDDDEDEIVDDDDDVVVGYDNEDLVPLSIMVAVEEFLAVLFQIHWLYHFLLIYVMIRMRMELLFE